MEREQIADFRTGAGVLQKYQLYFPNVLQLQNSLEMGQQKKCHLAVVQSVDDTDVGVILEIFVLKAGAEKSMK